MTMVDRDGDRVPVSPNVPGPVMSMSEAHFIICEKANRWAVAFRRQLRSVGIRVHETRSLDHCHRELTTAPRSLFAVEVDPETLERRLRWSWHTTRSFSRSRAMVLTCRGLEPADLMLREAGALHVLYSRRGIAPAARLVRRVIEPEISAPIGARQRIWAELPFAERM